MKKLRLEIFEHFENNFKDFEISKPQFKFIHMMYVQIS